MIDAAENVLELVGDTPLLRTGDLSEDVAPEIYLKLEYLNPGASVKDRPAMQIIEDAEQEGKLQPGGTIVEATSGNTGMGLALAAAVKGYDCIFTMPDKMSDEKAKALEAFGAEVIRCPTSVEPDDPESYYSVAEREAEKREGGFLANQYHNPSNPEGHYHTTGPEIWEQTNGEIDVFIAALGTGGTITGTAKYLLEQNSDIEIIGIDPVGSLYYDYFKTGEMTEAHSYEVEGFGEDIIPTTCDFDYVDDVVRVNDKECFLYTRELVETEGVFAGGSSGGILAGALKYARRQDEEKNIVCIMCDSASRYLSKIFDDDWMEQRGYVPGSIDERLVETVLNGSRETPVVRPGAVPNSVEQQLEESGRDWLPVVDDNRPIGIVTKETVDSANPVDKVSDFLDLDFTLVEPDTNLEIVKEYFNQQTAVIVVEDGAYRETIVPGDLD